MDDIKNIAAKTKSNALVLLDGLITNLEQIKITRDTRVEANAEMRRFHRIAVSQLENLSQDEADELMGEGMTPGTYTDDRLLFKWQKWRAYLVVLKDSIEKNPEDVVQGMFGKSPESATGDTKELDLNKAQEILGEIIDEIPILKGLSHSDQTFRLWRERATQSLALLSGKGFVKKYVLYKLQDMGFTVTQPKYAFGKNFETEAQVYEIDLNDIENILGTALGLMKYYDPESAEEGVAGDQGGAVKLFLGHGGNDIWKEIRNFLERKMRFEIEYFEKQSRTSEWNAQIIEEMIGNCSHAVIVATAEDEKLSVDEKGNQVSRKQPRANVIHEMGMCQGKLNIENVFVLLEGDRRYLSNTEGLQVIPFDPDNYKSALFDLRETFDDRGLIAKSKDD